MAKNRSRNAGGHKPRMSKLYDGRNVAVRPIPIIHDTSEDRAIESAAIDQQPRGELVNFPQGPRVKARGVFGNKLKSGPKGGTYNPGGVEDNR